MAHHARTTQNGWRMAGEWPQNGRRMAGEWRTPDWHPGVLHVRGPQRAGASIETGLGDWGYGVPRHAPCTSGSRWRPRRPRAASCSGCHTCASRSCASFGVLTEEACPYDFDPWARPGPKSHAYLQLGFALARANARMLINADASRRGANNRVRTSRLRPPT